LNAAFLQPRADFAPRFLRRTRGKFGAQAFVVAN
jgi:hypothetical protein